MQFFQLLVNQLKILYGDIKFEIDRENERVKVQRGDEIQEYTYSEIIDELDRVING